MSDEDNEADKLGEAEEVVGVIFPVDEDATLPLYPGEKALDQPAFGLWASHGVEDLAAKCPRFAGVLARC